MKRVITVLISLALILSLAPSRISEANTSIEKYELIKVDISAPDPQKSDAFIEGNTYRPKELYLIVQWKQYWSDGYVEDKTIKLGVDFLDENETDVVLVDNDGMAGVYFDVQYDLNYHLKMTDTSIPFIVKTRNEDGNPYSGDEISESLVRQMQPEYVFQIPIRVVSKNASLSEKYYVEPVKAMKTKVKRKKTYIYENGRKKKAWWHQVEIYWNSESSYAEKELKGIMKTRDTFDNSSNKAYPYMYRHSFTSKKKKIKTTLKIRPYREVWLNDDMNATLVFGKWKTKKIVV